MNNSSIITGCDFSSPKAWVEALLYILIAIVSAFGSLIVFICYCRHRALRSSTNVYIISLSASDMLVSAISIPYSFGVFLCNLRPKVDERTSGDLVYLVCDMLPSILSIYSLCFIAIDRAIAVTNPFFHTRYVNQKSAGISVALMWIFVASLVAFIYVLDKSDFTLFIIFLSYAAPVTIMLTCYSIMGYVANQHAKAISIMEKTSMRLLERGSSVKSEGNGNAVARAGDDEKSLTIERESKGTLKWLRERFRRLGSQDDGEGRKDKSEGLSFLKREFKAAMTLSLLLGVFVLAWTPFMALNMEQYRCETCHLPFDVVKYSKLLHYSNSALNPFLYIILNKRWRIAFQITVCCVQKRARVSEATMSELAAW